MQNEFAVTVKESVYRKPIRANNMPAYSDFKRVLRHAALRAKRQKVPFSLTIEWIESRWTGHCEITGIKFDTTSRPIHGSPFSPSLDRIKPGEGYTPGNCRIILQGINHMKGRGTDEDIKIIATALVASLPYKPPQVELDRRRRETRRINRARRRLAEKFNTPLTGVR